MDPERRQEIDELFHSALERPPGQRAAFLREVCAADESLRRRIEALLAAYEKAGSFLERPAFEAEARQLAAEKAQATARLRRGHTLGRYRIIDQLGAGGMGEVYLADDVKLDRKVALKILPAELAAPLCAIDPQFLGKHTSARLQHGKTLAAERRPSRYDLQRSSFCKGERPPTFSGARVLQARDSSAAPIQLSRFVAHGRFH